MPQGVQRIRRSTEDAALEYLARRPFENVFLQWLITSDRAPSTRERVFLFESASGVAAVAHFGRQVAIAAADAAAVPAFALVGRDHPGERMIVAPEPVAHGYWRAVKAWHRPPRIVRERQPLFVLQPQDLHVVRDGIEVRKARLAEQAVVARNSAEMIEHELGYDPRKNASDFEWNVRWMIERGRWWVGTRDGSPVFFCHIGPYTEHTAQLQGVWVPPELRRQGIARRAFGQICETLLQTYPTLSLYVNDFNTGAIRLYEELGFERTGSFATYLF
ncbi:MAG: GNAT family N-acetyltransferase [Candidatus Eremiobacteraeota bacterium]|nr:GNAT family N-acetyltransferase [Candidatus Eremiobacteraeota bacterium]